MQWSGLLLLVALLWTGGCRSESESPAGATVPSTLPGSAAKMTPERGPQAESASPGMTESRHRAQPQRLAPFLRPWTGDLDGMAERRMIRALVVPTRTQYWIDRGQQVGIEYELLKAFETEINASHPTGAKHVRIHVVFIPTSRDDLISGLLEGRGDLAAGTLTITPERLKEIDFGRPFVHGVKEIAVTGPQSAAVESLDDLSGREVFVRRSSSYWSHLEALQREFQATGKSPIRLRAAPEDLQDDDILEMLNAGLLDVTVVDRYAALLWAKVFPQLRPHEEVVVHDGGELAWMFRKGSPKLTAAVDEFARRHGKGSLFGNTIIKKYTGSTRFVKPATSPEELAKFRAMIDLFRKYGKKYRLDELLMMAQGYQESRLNQAAKSHVGAIGVMQIMPATGAELGVGDIRQLEPNIHGGVKYIRRLIDTYYADEPMDDLNKTLFAFAAYNCGPGRMRQLRREARERGLDPNRWFNNVEVIAGERVGSETVTYVSNIYKYYIAYTLVQEQSRERSADDAGRLASTESRPIAAAR